MEINWGDADSLSKALRREEERADDRMLLMVAGVFLAGYGLNAWASRHAVRLYEWCFTHQVVENGRGSCDMSAFGQSRADRGR